MTKGRKKASSPYSNGKSCPICRTEFTMFGANAEKTCGRHTCPLKPLGVCKSCLVKVKKELCTVSYCSICANGGDFAQHLREISEKDWQHLKGVCKEDTNTKDQIDYDKIRHDIAKGKYPRNASNGKGNEIEINLESNSKQSHEDRYSGLPLALGFGIENYRRRMLQKKYAVKYDMHTTRAFPKGPLKSKMTNEITLGNLDDLYSKNEEKEPSEDRESSISLDNKNVSMSNPFREAKGRKKEEENKLKEAEEKQQQKQQQEQKEREQQQQQQEQREQVLQQQQQLEQQQKEQELQRQQQLKQQQREQELQRQQELEQQQQEQEEKQRAERKREELKRQRQLQEHQEQQKQREQEERRKQQQQEQEVKEQAQRRQEELKQQQQREQEERRKQQRQEQEVKEQAQRRQEEMKQQQQREQEERRRQQQQKYEEESKESPMIEFGPSFTMEAPTKVNEKAFRVKTSFDPFDCFDDMSPRNDAPPSQVDKTREDQIKVKNNVAVPKKPTTKPPPPKGLPPPNARRRSLTGTSPRPTGVHPAGSL